MSSTLVCTPALHDALKDDDAAWSRLHYVGIFLDEDWTEVVDGRAVAVSAPEHLEGRLCPGCGSSLWTDPRGELAAICARLNRAVLAGDVAAKYTSLRALSADPHEVQVWRDMVAFERMTGCVP